MPIRFLRLSVPACALLLAACQSLPSLENRSVSSVITDAPALRVQAQLHLPEVKLPESGLAASDQAAEFEPAASAAVQAVSYAASATENPADAAQTAASKAESATAESALSPDYDRAHLYVLDNAFDAFIARAALIDAADSSLDLRYYIWRNDVSGNLLLRKLWRAANRGVRVRLLLDDNNTRGMDNLLAALDAHPNIEVRLFNPFVKRSWRALGYLTDFPRLNRRMHNKSLSADNRAAIIGGRNIGDEYFNAPADTLFSDMDVLLSGSVVGRIGRDFDRYWQSDSAYPLRSILPETDNDAGLEQLFNPPHPPQSETAYRQALAGGSAFGEALLSGSITYTAAPVRLFSDNPAKGLSRERRKSDIPQILADTLQQPQREVYLVSPYFVPTRAGVDILSGWVRRGVRVTVFTNSLRATDVAAVHSGYARYRKELLLSGVELYEFKPGYAVPSAKDKGLTGSSATSLHAKTFIVDQQRIFIGSLNLDPRSARLNTEMGILIEEPDLAAQMEQKLKEEARRHAYRLSLNAEGRVQWRDPDNGETTVREPEAPLSKRIGSAILSILPIERLL